MKIIKDIDVSTLPIGIGYYNSPIGLIRVCANEYGVTELDFVTERDADEIQIGYISGALLQLKEYFEGERKEFDLPVVLNGTTFQKAVWEALTLIKYGETASYKDIAISVNNEKASRAVGMANNRNPVALIVPCHRVIGSDGSLVGYGGGIDKKIWLLEHEKKNK